jgi:hypothetical protein
MTSRRGGFDVAFGTKRAGLNAKQPADKSGGKAPTTKAAPKKSASKPMKKGK